MREGLRVRLIETEKTKNRLTTRIVEVFDDLNGIDLSWVGIKSLIRVERTGTRAGQPYHQVVCYISSLISYGTRIFLWYSRSLEYRKLPPLD